MQEHLKDEQVNLKSAVELEDAGPQNPSEHFPVVAQNYEIVELIGHGGMGTVYKAINVSTGSTVAIKLFTASVSKDKATLKRFEQEANALASLDDPNLLTIYESGTSPDGAPYLVMEYIEGDNLSEVLTRGRIDSTRAFPLFTQMCDLLSQAHRRGIIHRDIKPSNIIITATTVDPEHNKKADYERVRIVDFGIAHILDSVQGDTTKLTQTGAVFGTPTYMSPEQCQGKQTVDQRSDIYSLGCVMYEVLTGHPPFSADNSIQVAMQHVSDSPKPLKDCSKNLGRVVLQCLAKDPRDRYKSVDELRQDLELVRQNHNPKHLKKLKIGKKRPNLSIVILCILLASLTIALNNKPPVTENLNLSNPPVAASTAAIKSAKAQADVRQLSAEIKLHPQDKFWYMKRAKAYSDLGKHHQAIADYTKAIELDPQDVHAYTNRGSDYMSIAKWDSAMKDVDKALSLSPNHVNAICTRAIVFMETEDYGNALIECEKAIQLDPGRFDAYLTRGRVYVRTKEFDKALKEFDTVIKMDPRSTLGYWNRSQCYLEQNHYAKSFEDATKAINIDPSDPFLYCNRAYVYLELQQYGNALDDLNKALLIDSENIDALTLRADTYTAQEQYKPAILDYTAAIEVAPMKAKLYESRAYAYSKSKSYDLAIADCNRALKLDKNLTYAKYLRDDCARFK